MEDKDLFFASIHDMDFEALAEGRTQLGTDEDPQDELTEEAHPELFYLACQKALVRLKRYAASAPSF